MNRLAFGVATLLVGLVFVFVISAQYSIDNLSPEFLTIYGNTAILPPQYWESVIYLIGFILIGAGVLVIWQLVRQQMTQKDK